MEPLAAPQQQQQQQHRKSCRIVTQYGDMTVVWESESSSAAHLSPGSASPRRSQEQQQAAHKTRPIIMTFHDLGLNSELQFASFCQHKEVRLMLQTFTMMHVNFVGQEQEAEPLEPGFKYPSCQQLAECIVDVCAHLRVRSFIALAVGAGAHIVSLLALMRPDLVDGLFLINPVMTSCSITEWLYFKMSAISATGHTHTPPHSNTASPKSSPGLRALNQSQPAPQQGAGSRPEVGGGRSRLRRLILSRNFKSGAQAGHGPTPPEVDSHHARLERCNSASSADHSRPQTTLGRRPPYEYLMYHHFGPGKFQRYRHSEYECEQASHALHQDHDSDQASGSPAGSLRRQGRLARAQSQTGSSRGSSPCNGLALNWGYLAGLRNQGLRQWHIQAAYRHYFGQLNGHNLWLFAESFAGRHSLNLRKDCGAAAHAAAAAATLGTSICSVFVGGAPAPLALGAPVRQPAAAAASQPANRKLDQDRGMVAGTKVRRTFTCQTLAMCSCVALHRERTSKLMSLLNPIQATCIQTDQLLVLEEKPDKVCQALRLFLQGIGYSMSTYERRLRLSSTPAGSSADSDSSTSSAAAAPGRLPGAHL